MTIPQKQHLRQILEATGYKLYADEDVLEHSPVGKVQPVTVFTIGKYIKCAELEKEYAVRGLAPADLISIASSEKPAYLASQWKDAEGIYCCVTFMRWNGGRDVDVRRYDSGWDGIWSFAGVPSIDNVKEESSIVQCLPKIIKTDSIESIVVLNGGAKIKIVMSTIITEVEE